MKWVAPEVRDEPFFRFSKEFGDSLARKVWQWWMASIDDSAPVSWISFAQLYLSFQLEQKHAGPLRQGRGWIDSAQFPVTPEATKFRIRCKYFRLMMQNLWKTHGWIVGRGTLRPKSNVLTCHIGCCSIPIKLERVAAVESWLEQKVQGVIAGLGVKLDSLPPAW